MRPPLEFSNLVDGAYYAPPARRRSAPSIGRHAPPDPWPRHARPSPRPSAAAPHPSADMIRVRSRRHSSVAAPETCAGRFRRSWRLCAMKHRRRGPGGRVSDRSTVSPPTALPPRGPGGAGLADPAPEPGGLGGAGSAHRARGTSPAAPTRRGWGDDASLKPTRPLGTPGSRQPTVRSPPMSIVVTEDRSAVRHIVLNRPEKRNAMSQELLRELGQALREAAADGDVHCVVLRGEGPVFSAGVDLDELAASAGQPGLLRPFRKVFLDCPN